MNALVCPSCGQEIRGASPGQCPNCQAPLPHVPHGEGMPSWFPNSPAPDTAAHTEQPTLVNSRPSSWPFLDPPRGPGELGWLGPYRVIKVLGQGGMGIVFEAEDTNLGRHVALKVMAPEAARDVASRKRFLREARMTASIHSENVITIHQVGEIEDVPFLAMELLRGETLAAWLRHGHKAGPATVLDFGLQVARGLEVAHAAGLVHRDVKPANLWIESPGGRVKLLDFGLARLSQDASPLTQVGTVVGTPTYMSPEQAEGGVIDGRSDLFSLGCVLYELATGAPPFVGATTFAILTAMAVREPPSLRSLEPAYPAALSAAVMRLLAKKPADRPATAAAFANELVAVAEAYPSLRPAWLTGSSAAHPAVAPRGVSRRKFWIVGLGGVAAVAAAAGGAYWYVHSGRRRGGATAQGVSADRVLFGMSAPFSGPTAELGRGMRTGIEAFFAEVNGQGGIAGRKLELVALDDGYEPERALACVRELAEERRVFGFVGNVGTPTTLATLPYVLEKQMLFFGAFTGMHQLRKEPPDRCVFNYRASLAEEMAAAVRYLIETRRLAPEKVAVFDQDDGYGESGFRGVVRAMRQYDRHEEQIVRVRYPRNTIQVEQAVKEILRQPQIEAVVLVPTYRPAAQFIRQVRAARPKMIFTSTAFVSSEALAEELRQFGPSCLGDVIVAQMTPPLDSQSALVLGYRKQLRQHASSETPSSTSLEGYVVAAILAEGLRRAGEELTTETLVAALESMRDYDLGLGVPVRFSPSDHQAIHKVWGIELGRDGKYRSIELD